MGNENLDTIHTLKAQLEEKLHKLIEEFQLHAQIKGIQVQKIVIHQNDWHNGYDENAPGKSNEALRSGPHWGYRINKIDVIVVIP